MPTTFTPPDHEFAAASGDNVNWDPDWSYFDYPPNSTANLTVTSNDGDLDPGKFETGESYDLTWTGHGGGNIEDAVVIRSDYLGPGQGAIVFEGTNTVSGELVQIVWTPSFDLESWYYDHGGGPSNSPGFWTSDQDPESFQFACFAKGTMIETRDGPRAVETLCAGDLVMTLDHGPQEILWTHSSDQPLEHADIQSKPVLISAGALGPDRPTHDLIVSPQHRMLVGGQGQIKAAFEIEYLAPAKALVDLQGIRFMNGKRAITWVHFACARHEVVFANGCASESLLLGPMALQPLTRSEQAKVVQTFSALQSDAEALNGHAVRPCLSVGSARQRIEAHLKQKTTRKAQEAHKWDADLAIEKSEIKQRRQRQPSGQVMEHMLRP
ncbi:Hint domain-containing protein [Antarctobacter sp.]|uniref:Hint domain-containing protein n=1 Tax=Antarctobacter sp. TaxID=1872577 RepID=UPI002B2697E4|nr:Hint domain-containing protein [Antarctobacter sp.]